MALLYGILLFAASSWAQDGPIVDTIYGRVKGAYDTTESGKK